MSQHSTRRRGILAAAVLALSAVLTPVTPAVADTGVFIVDAVAGGGATEVTPTGVPVGQADFGLPWDVAADAAGNIFVSDRGIGTSRVYLIPAAQCTSGCPFGLPTTPGLIYTLAGVGTSSFSGDGAPATAAELSGPSGIALDPAGNLLIADSNNNRIRMVAAADCASACPYGLPAPLDAGSIYTIAGDGTTAPDPDGTLATSTGLNSPFGVAVDESYNVIIADSLNHRVRVMLNDCSVYCYGVGAPVIGGVYTLAGTGVFNYNGDNIAATTAQLNFPRNVAVDSAHNVLIADLFNGRIRIIKAPGCPTGCYGLGAMTTGRIYTVTTSVPFPLDVALDTDDNLLLPDDDGDRVVMRINGSCAAGCHGTPGGAAGTEFTLIGDGSETTTGDGASATDATIHNPNGIGVTDALVLVLDAGAQRLRGIGDAVLLDVQIAGSGTVTCTPGPCTRLYLPGTVVTIEPTDPGDPNFNGFDGPCSGPVCTFPITASTAVEADFTGPPEPPVPPNPDLPGGSAGDAGASNDPNPNTNPAADPGSGAGTPGNAASTTTGPASTTAVCSGACSVSVVGQDATVAIAAVDTAGSSGGAQAVTARQTGPTLFAELNGGGGRPDCLGYRERHRDFVQFGFKQPERGRTYRKTATMTSNRGWLRRDAGEFLATTQVCFQAPYRFAPRPGYRVAPAEGQWTGVLPECGDLPKARDGIARPCVKERTLVPMRFGKWQIRIVYVIPPNALDPKALG